MLDTYVRGNSQRESNIIDDTFVSVITTLFIEEMAIERKAPPLEKNWYLNNQLRQNSSIAPVPCSKQTEAIALKEYGTRKAEPNNMKRRSRSDGTSETIRTFILGLSDSFNNLLMGIWGNLSLISLHCNKSDAVSQRVSEMEQIIHNGSALINAVFGYLGERRIVAKNIRLTQLIREINGILPLVGDRIKNDILRSDLTAPESNHSITMLALNCSRMLTQLLDRIQDQYRLILKEKKVSKDIRARLQVVQGLIARVWGIVTLLNHYTGVTVLDVKKISAKMLIAKLARNYETRFPQMEISLDLSQRLPWILADRSMLQFVLNQLMENAADAMSGRGRLHIEARSLKSEPARNRCVAHRWTDTIVITMSDSGSGMDFSTLLHVFDPFFTGRRNSSHLGMGLAASWGIVKAHGGYIHVQSRLSQGTTVKIYLPLGLAQK
jgi:signal transduction histidine kinase